MSPTRLLYHSLWTIFAAFVFCFLTLFTNTGVANAATVDVSGTIMDDTSWTADNVYRVTGNLQIGITATLTIEAGTVVKINVNQSILVDGNLQVQGTETMPVYFTSYRDDAVGGDTDGDGGVNPPAVGDWGRIRFSDISSDASLIDHAILRFGGYVQHVGDFGGIEIEDASPKIRNTEISFNVNGIYVSSEIAPSQPWLTCLAIENNRDFGIRNTAPSFPIDATEVWWGSGSGPKHDVINPNGLGNKISDGVIVSPWLRAKCGFPVPETDLFIPRVGQ